MKVHRILVAVMSFLTAASMTFVPVSNLPMVPYTITASAGTTYDSLTYIIENGEVTITRCDYYATKVVGVCKK